MQLFLIAFQQPIPFGISTIVVGLMIFIMLRSAMVAEGGSTWVKRITNPNAKFLFAFLLIGWAVVFGIGLQLVPHTGANSPYGGIGLIALFTGFVAAYILLTIIGTAFRGQGMNLYWPWDMLRQAAH